jgi:hypothetical protein
MAGSDQLEDELRAAGAPTVPAEILSAKEGRFQFTRGASAADQVANATSTWKVQLHVMPEGDAPFEVEIKQGFAKTGSGPKVGSTIGVLYDPNDHTRVAIDHSTAGAVVQATNFLSPGIKSSLESALGASTQDILSEAMADPKAFREKMLADRAAPVAMPDFPPMTGFPTPAPPVPAPPAPVPASAADELLKLAELRDRGVLSDEEFQAEKQRVLGRPDP